jgi:predicted metal-dependent HD superfamily phosphohydrolase
MLQQTFKHLLQLYTADEKLVNQHWDYIVKSYNNKKRHYHNLNHLENMLGQILLVKQSIHNWHAVLFALYYHDAVYNSLKSNNEEESALVAKKIMEKLQVPSETILLATNLILATKQHLKNDDNDINYFTDADLSILGQPWETYVQYTKQIRKEYAIYPNFMYNPGRKKVLLHFNNMDCIFKTGFFFNNYEITAKQNIAKELQLY